MDKNKGKKWALNVLWMVVAFNGFKLLFGLASANPSEAAGMAIVSMIGGVVILCPIAFTIGYFQKNVS